MFAMTQRLIASTLLLALLSQTGCGTLIYPERRGQSSGKIDPAIAILDGVGVLLFVIPGLIAFAVDFATGAIYLPGGRRAQLDVAPLRLDNGHFHDKKRLSAALSAELGMAINLDDPQLQQQAIAPGLSPELAVWQADLGLNRS